VARVQAAKPGFELTAVNAATVAERSGAPLPGIEVRIVDAEGHAQPPGEPGEVLIRGFNVMSGYFEDPKATAEAFRGGWMHTGDLAVEHPDGYVEIKDRAKDIIISGGENVSSVEVEIALYKHPATQLAAVVARPDEKWGETPCAFVQLKPGASASEEDYIDWCRQNLARFKIPKKVVFGPVPTTATGKIQKYVLRERARQLE
jgi:fatty-acyl-CoA synthase